ncbi:MAG: hypothetical protein EA397_03670 [Deltaproteobacteria bacterium]|nr:MAG: hypothetical protein EA397_03670 [Deltaproteobacteria bacterium]
MTLRVLRALLREHVSEISMTARLSVVLTALTLMIGSPSPAHAYGWSNCDDLSHSNHVTSMGWLTHPGIYGESFHTMINVSLIRVVSRSAPARIVVEHTVNGRTIPCLDDFLGSCTYDDVCDVFERACAKGILYGTCSCPISRGAFNFNTFEVLQDHGAMMLGSHTWKFKMYDTTSGALEGCLEVTAEVSQCEDPRCPDDMSCDLVYCLE